jgi:hypothetical protein
MGKFFGRSVNTIHPKALRAEVSASDTKVRDAAAHFGLGIWMALKSGS